MVGITQNELKNLLDYCPETGFFTRLISCRGAEAGSIAGGYDGQGYATIMINYKSYKAHRLAWFYMTGKWPKDQIDHINHVRDDNRFINLREVDRIENHKNMSISKKNTSGVTGVCWANREKKWLAYIRVNCKNVRLGQFIDKFEAICVRKSAEYRHGFHENHGTSHV